jgi:hypothetical protein
LNGLSPVTRRGSFCIVQNRSVDGIHTLVVAPKGTADNPPFVTDVVMLSLIQRITQGVGEGRLMERRSTYTTHVGTNRRCSVNISWLQRLRSCPVSLMAKAVL